MDERVAKLRTPEQCERFIRNVQVRFPDLAKEARRRCVELRAEAWGARGEVEREALQAVYAYEEVLSAKNGKRTTASRTWPMIKRRGILAAVESVVTRRDATVAYQALSEMGLQDFSFEAVVTRFPEHFTAKAIEKAKQRLSEC